MEEPSSRTTPNSVVDGFVSKYLVHCVQARSSASGRPSYEGWVRIWRPRPISTQPNSKYLHNQNNYHTPKVRGECVCTQQRIENHVQASRHLGCYRPASKAGSIAETVLNDAQLNQDLFHPRNDSCDSSKPKAQSLVPRGVEIGQRRCRLAAKKSVSRRKYAIRQQPSPSMMAVTYVTSTRQKHSWSGLGRQLLLPLIDAAADTGQSGWPTFPHIFEHKGAFADSTPALSTPSEKSADAHA